MKANNQSKLNFAQKATVIPKVNKQLE